MKKTIKKVGGIGPSIYLFLLLFVWMLVCVTVNASVRDPEVKRGLQLRVEGSTKGNNGVEGVDGLGGRG